MILPSSSPVRADAVDAVRRARPDVALLIDAEAIGEPGQHFVELRTA